MKNLVSFFTYVYKNIAMFFRFLIKILKKIFTKENMIKFLKFILKTLNYKILWILFLSWLTVSYVNSNSEPELKIDRFYLLDLKPSYFEKLFKYWLIFGLLCLGFYLLRTSGFIKTKRTFLKFVKF